MATKLEVVNAFKELKVEFELLQGKINRMVAEQPDNVVSNIGNAVVRVKMVNERLKVK